MPPRRPAGPTLDTSIGRSPEQPAERSTTPVRTERTERTERTAPGRAFTARLDRETDDRFAGLAQAMTDSGLAVMRPFRKGSDDLRGYPVGRVDVLRALVALADGDETLRARLRDHLASEESVHDRGEA